MVRGGKGDDEIDVLDGDTKDVVYCGRGTDEVSADPGEGLRGCEVANTEGETAEGETAEGETTGGETTGGETTGDDVVE